MNKYNVYGVSDWPENYGEHFLIYSSKSFLNDEEAILAAKAQYSDDLEIIIEVVGEA